MKKQTGTREQLANELEKMRQRIAHLDREVTVHKQAEKELLKSELGYRLLAENVTDVIWTMDMNLRFTYISPSVTRQYGYSVEEAMASPIEANLTPSSFKAAMKVFKEEMAIEKMEKKDLFRPRTLEVEQYRKDGSTVWSELEIAFLRDADGQAIGIVGVSRDITERKRAEEELRESEEKIRNIFESILDAIVVSDLEGHIIDENDAALRIQGYSSKEEVIGKSGFDFIAEEDRARAIQAAMKAAEEGYGYISDVKFVSKDGIEHDTEATASLVRDASGNPIGFVSVTRDITEHRRALRESEEKYRTVIDHSIQGLVIAQGIPPRLIFANSSIAHILGYTIEELLSLSPEETRALVHPEDQNMFFRNYQDRLEGKSAPTQYEVRAIRKDKSVRWVEIFSTRIELQGQPAVQAAYVDITERKRAEEELRDSEEKLRVMFESITDGIVVTDLQGIILNVNDVVVRMSGLSREEIIGRDGFALIPREDRDKIVEEGKRVIKEDTGLGRREYEVSPKVGSSRTTNLILGTMHDSDGNPTGFVAIAQDITERKQAEEALKASEEKYRLLIDNLIEPLTVYDSNGLILLINVTGANNLGSMPEDVIGKSLYDFFPDTADIYVERARRVFESGVGLEFEDEVPLPSGNRWFYSNIQPVKDTSGKVISVQNISYDITERKRAEEALRESEERFRSLVENAPYMIFIADREGKILFVNYTPAGFTVEDTVGTSVFDYVPAEHREEMSRNINGVFESGEPTSYEITGAGPHGTASWYSTRVGPIKHDGYIIAVTLMVLDITERKRAEEALRDSEEKLHLIFESINDGIIVSDLEGQIIDENEAAVRLQGHSDKVEVIGRTGFEFIAEKDRARAMEDAMKAVERGYGLAHEYTFVDKDGREYDAEASASLLRDSAGNAVGFISIFRDITERKRAEEALRENEEKLHAMFESITDGIVVTDLRGIITDVNDVAANMSGLSREEMIGKDGFSLIPSEDRDKIVDQGKKIVRGETGPVRMEHEISPRIGSASTTNLVLGTMHDSDGNPTGFVAIAQDFTERKRAETERERLVEELGDKSEELEQLVFIASHDLRSPLVNIQGFAREIEQSLQQVRLSLEEEDIPSALKEKLAAPIGEDITDSLNYILSSSSKIDSMLTGLLKVSRLGRVTLTIEKINMKDLMAEVVGSFEFQTREAGVKLEVGRLPQCRGDRAQLDQVFSNLIDNALKFLDPKRPGIIRISGRKEDRQAVYTVEDNGVGIAPEHHKTVFQIFRRFAPMDTPGEGLGLNIVRRILERHSGKIWLESEPGKGSRFHVSLPIRD